MPFFAQQMWGWGPNRHGYCGATSIQTAGLYYGNWFSQEQVRIAAGSAEVLLDVNADVAATALYLNFDLWDIANETAPQAFRFLAWIKTYIDVGVPVVFGAFESEPKGDMDYDHVVLAVGYKVDTGRRAISELYYNDWYLQQHRTLYRTTDIRDRAACLQPETPVQPYTYCLPHKYLSGMALTGNFDPNGELLPVTLDVGSWSEPDDGSEDHVNAPPVQFTPTATAAALTPGVAYALLRFDNASRVPPMGGFLASGTWSISVNFTATDVSAVLTGLAPIWSNGTYFYRCVVAA
jgi:hypothetical protein